MPPRPRSWSDEQLVAAVRNSKSISEVLEKLGLVPRGHNYHTFYRHRERLGLDIGHFVGRSHLKGRLRPEISVPLHRILVQDSTYKNMPRLTIRLVRSGMLEPKCDECGIVEWQGKKLRLQLDHMNGERTDNRRENLRLLCPNCHSQTATYVGANSAAGKRTRRQFEKSLV